MVIELIGFVGLLFLAASFFSRSIVLIRCFSMVSASLLSLYGFLSASWVLSSAGLIGFGANAFFLVRTLRQGPRECEYRKAEADLSDLVLRYLHFHQKNILQRYPNFDIEVLLKFWKDGGELYLALHRAKIRGLALWAPKDKDVFLVFDYLDPKYLYLGIEKKFYALLETLEGSGYKRIVLDPHGLSPRGRGYFRRKGFRYEKDLFVRPFLD